MKYKTPQDRGFTEPISCEACQECWKRPGDTVCMYGGPFKSHYLKPEREYNEQGLPWYTDPFGDNMDYGAAANSNITHGTNIDDRLIDPDPGMMTSELENIKDVKDL